MISMHVETRSFGKRVIQRVHSPCDVDLGLLGARAEVRRADQVRVGQKFPVAVEGRLILVHVQRSTCNVAALESSQQCLRTT